VNEPSDRESLPARELLRRERTRLVAFLAERGVREVRVFGSIARGDDAGRSDIDLLIELPDAGALGNELLTVLGLSEELSALLGVRVDVATRRTLRPEIIDLALAESIPL
jgi:predicted nucleotidyltransferase